ncbi:cupredoxin domain-containing protein [Haloarcula litorea]|uniref:cupredoxin domain-containing protein n=1 Tax=Haloarcula litorea TaxID=3032579 RepID=UPI0023E83177|nr:plastocyanin/azurin family copper-binding protein [Halomicroarcula sp. GDY20]
MAPDPLGSSRRDVVKALGAGPFLAGVGGTVSAQSGDEGGNRGEDDREDQPAGDAAGTVHEVRTLVRGPPTNADRPADFFFQPTGLYVRPGDVVRFVFTTPDHNVVSYHPAFGMRRRVPTGVAAFSSPLLGWTDASIAPDQIEPPAEPGGGDGTDGEDDDGMDEEDDGMGGDDGGDDSDDEDSDGGTTPPTPSTWLHAFDTPGVYDLLCSPHEGFGMAMRVVVSDVTEAPFETSDPEALAPPRAGPVGLARVTLTDPALEPSNVVERGTVAWGDLASVGGGGAGDGDGG